MSIDRVARALTWAWLAAAVCGNAVADPRTSEEPVVLPTRFQSEPGLMRPADSASTDWQARAALDLKRIEHKRSSGMSIVELPPEGVPDARSRPHHALSVSSEMPQRMLRSLGVEATDCSTRFRLPTRLRQDANGGGTSIEVRAQLGLACHF